METRIRPLSSPCEFGFVVFGSLTSGPLRICGAITMKMISSTSTTSTSGVMLMLSCILPGSPSRIGRPSLFGHRRLDFRHFDVKLLEFRYFEQAVHELGRRPIHLDMESLNLAREVVEADHGAEKTNKRGSGADRGKEPKPLPQLNQRFGHGVPECARDELERSARITPALSHPVVLGDARQDHLRHVGTLVRPRGFDQILDISPLKELLELGLELFRLARGRNEAAVLVYDHPHRKNGKQGEANHHRASEYTDVP